MFQGESAPTSPIEVQTEDWAESQADSDYDVFIDEVLQLDPYGLILSLLYLP
jgi:hypothetical protein